MHFKVVFAALIAAVAAVPASSKSHEKVEYGPSVNIAIVQTAEGTGENQAWAFGRSYCSARIKLTSGRNICAGGRTYYLKNVPLIDKSGSEKPDDERPDISFYLDGCQAEDNGGKILDPQQVVMVANIDGKIKSYGCTQNRENRQCNLNGERGTTSDVTVYMRCGIDSQ